MITCGNPDLRAPSLRFGVQPPTITDNPLQKLTRLLGVWVLLRYGVYLLCPTHWWVKVGYYGLLGLETFHRGCTW